MLNLKHGFVYHNRSFYYQHIPSRDPKSTLVFQNIGFYKSAGIFIAGSFAVIIYLLRKGIFDI